MYKRISHNIVEEHFEHPAVLPAGIGMPYGGLDAMACMTATSMANIVHPHTGTGTSVIRAEQAAILYDNKMQFRMDARTAWGKWVWSLLNYSISLNGNLAGTDQVKGRMHKNAAALGDSIIPFYGPSAGRSLTSALIAIDDIGMHYVEALKAKAPQAEIDKIIKTWEPYVADIAKVLNELNPNYWPQETVADIFANVVKGWQDELTARATNDLVADEIAIDFLNNLVITGVPPSAANSYRSLADVFSWGIIAQFPDMFV